MARVKESERVRYRCPKCGSMQTKRHTKTQAGSQRVYCYSCGSTSTLDPKKGGRPASVQKFLYAGAILATSSEQDIFHHPFSCWAIDRSDATRQSHWYAQEIMPESEGWRGHEVSVADITHMTANDGETFPLKRLTFSNGVAILDE